MITQINGEWVIIETLDDFYILLEQQMGREVREWLSEQIDTEVDAAIEANLKEW